MDVADNMSMLNDNLESLLLLGSELERISGVWATFHSQIVAEGEGGALGS